METISEKAGREVYCHIGNGGVTFRVEDNGHGPEVVIESSHFGNNTTRQAVAVGRKTLDALRDLFVGACAREYSDEYCYAARAEEERERCCGDGDCQGHEDSPEEEGEPWSYDAADDF